METIDAIPWNTGQWQFNETTCDADDDDKSLVMK